MSIKGTKKLGAFDSRASDDGIATGRGAFDSKTTGTFDSGTTSNELNAGAGATGSDLTDRTAAGGSGASGTGTCFFRRREGIGSTTGTEATAIGGGLLATKSVELQETLT
jgi:hypothetical protein